MPGTLDSVLHVVTPYGVTDTCAARKTPAVCRVGNGVGEHRRVQDILADLVPTDQRINDLDDGGFTSNDLESVKNLQLELAYEAHSRSTANQRPCIPPALRKTVLLPPQNSYAYDSIAWQSSSSYKATKDYVECYDQNTSGGGPVAKPLDANKSALVYKYNKACKVIKHLPNPVSRQLYDEMTERNMEGDELMRLYEMPCYKEHVDNKEPPCITYFSPKPSQISLHKPENKFERDVRISLRTNATLQAPLSTVEVLLNITSQYTFHEFSSIMQKYGKIETIVRHGERSFRVVYSDLVSACNAVVGLQGDDMIQCTWHHRHMNLRKFRKKKHGPLQIFTES